MRTKNVLVKKRTQMEPKLTTVVGSDQAKKRFSVLIQILKVEVSDRKPFGSDLSVIATETGFFTVSPLFPKKASKKKEKPFCHAVAIFLFVSGVKKSEKHRDRKSFSVVMFGAKGKNRGLGGVSSERPKFRTGFTIKGPFLKLLRGCVSDRGIRSHLGLGV